MIIMFVKSYAKNAGRLTYLINVSYLFLQMVVLVSRRRVFRQTIRTTVNRNSEVTLTSK